jgi:hypothetical protein
VAVHPAAALSVIVAASDSAVAVARTLASLGRQRGADRLEVIVAAGRDCLAGPLAAAASPGDVRWVIAPPGTGVPRLRRLGLDRANAPVVAFTEDSCVFGPCWAEAWLAAFGNPALTAATGPVEPAMGHAVIDQAVFLCEYAPFLAPGGTGTRTWAETPGRLAGNNFAVRRGISDLLDPYEIHEMNVARAVAGRDGGLAVVPAARVGHARRYRARQAIADRLRFGRAYGRLRAGRWPRAVRLAAAAAGPAILAVQAARLAVTLLARRRLGGPFAAALPVTVGLLSAWSVGEWLGWLEALGLRPAARTPRETADRPAARAIAPARWQPAGCRPAPPAA